jgi:hypothetical protein
MVLLPILFSAVLASSSPPAETTSCPHPPIVPVVQIDDLIYDNSKPLAQGGLVGDNVCELYCGIKVVDSHDWVPACAAYPCEFELHLPGGVVVRQTIEFGPSYDGLDKPIEVGRVCNAWSAWYPSGWYRATLHCGASASAELPEAIASFDFWVEHSHPTGFDISPSLWQGRNHCPRRPDFGLPHNPSPQRKIPGRLPG